MITVIGEGQAKAGNRFYFMGPQTECEKCKLRNICFNLEVGALYEITGVRDQLHDCSLNEDKVRVVEVEKRSRDAVAPKKSAIEGSIITFHEPECERMDCKNYLVCHPPATEDGKKYTVVKIEGSVDCPIGENLVFVGLF